MTGAVPPFLDRLRARAERGPDAVAVREHATSLTYRALVTRVEDRAAQLRRAGIGPGDRVAIVAENSADYLVSAFGVWNAGGVLVTVYPSSGETDLSHCLAGSAPALVLAESHLVPAVSAVVTELAGPRCPVVDVHEPLPEGLRVTPVDAQVEVPDDLALICYTSGSTSRPKAVMQRHRGLAGAAEEFARVWHVGPADATIVCLPMAWAFGLVTTSMTTLMAGGTVLPLARARPELITRAVVEDGATLLAGVTTMFAKLVEHLRGLAERPDLSGLRLCISGGEPRNEDVFAAWTSLSGCPVHDNFAASECFPVITYDPVEDPVPVHRSAGKVVAGAAMRLVDPTSGRDVPPGEPGEALWRGPALFAGYWGDPAATADALTADGWYRTRDLVRVDERGYVFVEGRLSDMIIRGGSNVSPSEVEAVVRAHPSIRDVAVVGVPDAVYGQAVAAAVVPADDGTDPAALRVELATWCRRRLAGYKVPASVVVVDRLPLNPATGKVDRRRVLADIEQAREGAMGAP